MDRQVRSERQQLESSPYSLTSTASSDCRRHNTPNLAAVCPLYRRSELQTEVQIGHEWSALVILNNFSLYQTCVLWVTRATPSD